MQFKHTKQKQSRQSTYSVDWLFGWLFDLSSVEINTRKCAVNNFVRLPSGVHLLCHSKKKHYTLLNEIYSDDDGDDVSLSQS